MIQKSGTRSTNLLYLVSMLLVISLGSYLQSVNFPWGLLLTEALLILAPALIFIRLDNQPETIRLPFNRIPVLVGLACLAGGVGLWLFGSLLETVLIGLTGFSSPGGAEMLPQTPIEALLIFLGFAIAAPLCEEILFRGVIQERYMQAYRPFVFLTLPALLFAFFHLRLVGLTALLPISFFITFVYWRTRSLIASMLVHFGNNLIAAIIMMTSGLSISMPLSLPSIPAAVVGLLVTLLSLIVITKSSGTSQTRTKATLRFHIQSYWPLLIAGVVYLASAGLEINDMITGTEPPLVSSPWHEHIEMQYEVRHKGNQPVGTANCSLQPGDTSIKLNCLRETEPFQITIGNSQFSGGDVTFSLEAEWNAAMQLVSLQASEKFETGSHDWQVDRVGGNLAITVYPYQQDQETLSVDQRAMIEEEWPWRLMALDFKPGIYSTQIVLPLTWRQETQDSGPAEKPLRLVLVGQETIEIPAGMYKAWHLLADNNESAWYDVESPHTLLRYEGRMFDYWLTRLVSNNNY